jgi:hypothetical protein
MAAKLPALRVGLLLSLGGMVVLISVKGRVDSKTTERLEGLRQWKNPMIEPPTSRLVALPQPTKLPRDHSEMEMMWESVVVSDLRIIPH